MTTLTDRVALKRADGGEIATVWGRVRFVTNNASNVVVRYRSDIGAGDRIISRKQELEIVSTSDLTGRRVYLLCNCRRVPHTPDEDREPVELRRAS